ncbi:MAG: hypothetical protein UV33_C0004G0007 [Candidatus Daviesbacteria bacterium GW2011_GWA1_42_6]|uniref:Glycosyltransferase RgtA/B/C/D-like domain-containing protein n=1 Tax=Candidatus Daviesbacteria bacterium GW2011_GWA1_42_6 TaxID=1618420 RepID=A0A0G1AWQ4_9BACT|nr:MAG: hypothetical protein UV33_C0004G0007 [Candidatus Daviesbacteria bacterium GW2011_GWA1_42_6]
MVILSARKWSQALKNDILITVRKYRTIILLLGIFLLALLLRFLYFPQNIYFGFDQARDAFATLGILKGDLKIVGPPTGVEGLFHGPLYYYLYAPFYFLSNGDPAYAAGFLRVANALGVFLIFLVGKTIFDKKVGFLAAFLFAISFEQTQYALYFNHPSLAVLSVTLFYFGLSLLLFRKQQKGLVLALLGLGLSLQFEFILIYLFFTALVLGIVFHRSIPKVSLKVFLVSLGGFLITTCSFILAEVIFNFRVLKNLTSIVGGAGGNFSVLDNFYILITRLVSDNIVSHNSGTVLALLFLTILFLGFLKNSNNRPKLIFLLIWILGGIIPYINNKSQTPLYYYSAGAGVGLLILYSFFIDKVWEKAKVLALVLILIPIVSNLSLIRQNNPGGVIPTINVQSGMLLSDEKQVVDYIYNSVLGDKFSVSALTMPLQVNTTWSYLFQWYGQKEYGFLPVWGENTAAGYPGNLKVITAKSTLPDTRFLIIEPTRGIRQGLIDNFLREEGYFTKVLEEKKIGEFIVQRRKPF